MIDGNDYSRLNAHDLYEAGVRKVYIAGPMRGYVDFNFPAFHAAEARCRAYGFEVVNPASIDESNGFNPSTDEAKSLAFYMAQDLPEVLACDAVVVLPKWVTSQGARIETAVLAECKGDRFVVDLDFDEVFDDDDLSPGFGKLDAEVECDLVDDDPAFHGTPLPKDEAEAAPAWNVGCCGDPADCSGCPVETCDSRPNGARIVNVVFDEVAHIEPWQSDFVDRFFRRGSSPIVSFTTADSKASNPKDAIGSSKLPMHLWPETATVYGVVGLLDGMLKYGRSNWRASGVRFSIYLDAIRRHLAALDAGEWLDPESGAPHLGHMLACCAIIADAHTYGVLRDDRQFGDPARYRALVDTMTPHVERLKALHSDRTPKHFTIADTELIGTK